MDVVACFERTDQARVLREVRDATELDLVVVGYEQLIAIGWNEGLAEGATHFGTHRNVVQVGRIGAQSTGSGNRLVEGRADAVTLPHLVQQPNPIGRAQLLHLSVLEEMLDDRVLAAQFFERCSVGAVAGLGLLLRGEF